MDYQGKLSSDGRVCVRLPIRLRAMRYGRLYAIPFCFLVCAAMCGMVMSLYDLTLALPLLRFLLFSFVDPLSPICMR